MCVQPPCAVTRDVTPSPYVQWPADGRSPEDSAREGTDLLFDEHDTVDYAKVAHDLSATAPSQRTRGIRQSPESSPEIGYQSDGVVDFDSEVRQFRRRANTASPFPDAPHGGLSNLIDLESDESDHGSQLDLGSQGGSQLGRRSRLPAHRGPATQQVQPAAHQRAPPHRQRNSKAVSSKSPLMHAHMSTPVALQRQQESASPPARRLAQSQGARRPAAQTHTTELHLASQTSSLEVRVCSPLSAASMAMLCFEADL